MRFWSLLFVPLCLLHSFPSVECRRPASPGSKALTLDVLHTDGLHGLIEKFFAKIKDILKANDPFNYKGGSAVFNQYGMLVNASATDLVISGISTLNLTNLVLIDSISNISLAAGVSFDYLMVTGNYNLYMDLLSALKLYGSGPFGVSISKVQINVTASLLTQLPPAKVLKFIELQVSVGFPLMKVDIKKFLDLPELSEYISIILKDIVPNLLQMGGPVQQMMSNWMQSTLNDYTKRNSLTLKDVTKFMRGVVQ